MSDSLTELQRQLNLTKIEINAASKIATKKTMRRARKLVSKVVAKQIKVPYRTLRQLKRFYYQYIPAKNTSRLWIGFNDMPIKYVAKGERNKIAKRKKAFQYRVTGHYYEHAKNTGEAIKAKPTKILKDIYTEGLKSAQKIQAEIPQIYEEEFINALPQVISPF
jgi:hypothetical protein